MKISTKGRYALRVMIDLAINSNGKYISLKAYLPFVDIFIFFFHHELLYY